MSAPHRGPGAGPFRPQATTSNTIARIRHLHVKDRNSQGTLSLLTACSCSRARASPGSLADPLCDAAAVGGPDTIPDIVVGASAYKHEESEGTNPACDDTPAVDTCIRSGRVYVYRGENIVGTSPETNLSTATWNIVNPYAQANDPNTRIFNQLELFGHSIAPVGDAGAAPARRTPPASARGEHRRRARRPARGARGRLPRRLPDERARQRGQLRHRREPAARRPDRRGAADLRHPDPDPGSIFGFTIYNQPAIGNAGGSALPEIFIPAGGQDTDQYRGEGIGFLMNSASLVNGNIVDPQPAARIRPPAEASARAPRASATSSATRRRTRS